MPETSSAMRRIVTHILAGHPELDQLDPDFDLIESRLINSLGFVEFLCLLEELTGREILLEDVTADDFRTLAAIERRFFTGADR